jgi:hypothetical protein
VYALLSLVLALIGALLGLLPRFRAHVPTAFGALIGLYLGMVLAIVIWGDPATDDLLEMLERGGASILLTLICAVLGGLAGSRLAIRNMSLLALALLLGGFLGGAVFVMLDIAPSSSIVGVAPYVLGSGIVFAGVVWRLQHRTTMEK